MRTIPTRHPKSSPRGDYPVLCDICGVPWLRSRMRRDPDGRLRCPDDQKGLETAGLTQRNLAEAQRASAILGRARRPRQGTMRVDTYPAVAVVIPVDGATVVAGVPVTWFGTCTSPVTLVELYLGHPTTGTFRGKDPVLLGSAVPLAGSWALELLAGVSADARGAVELFAKGTGGGICVSVPVHLEVLFP